MQYNEKEVLQSVKNHSKKAFEQIYKIYVGKLYNFVMRISKGNSYVAEELVQRVFIKVWETRENINPDKSFISYLCTIAKNMLINEYEHQTIHFIYEEYVKVVSTENDESTQKEVDRKLLEDFIFEMAEKLPPKRKEVFILSKKNGYSNKEIAEQLNITESTVETQLSKALVFMKVQLQKYYEFIIAGIMLIFEKNL